MKKYNVVIIDDEYLIIEGLKMLIDWEELGCEIIGSAADGDQGLELIRQVKPDIVITDIRMPNTTGIEMIRNALSICNCKFIVLSGYSDFSYAKQCMSLGVQEYLLKPIEEDLLIQSLKKTIQQINAEQDHVHEVEQLTMQNSLLQELSTDYFLRDLINTYFDTLTDFILTLNNYEIDFPTGLNYACTIWEFPAAVAVHPDLRMTLSNAFQLEFPKRYLLFSYSENCFMCILSFNDPVTMEELSSKIVRVKNEFSSHIATTAVVGIGNIYDDPLKIHLSAKQAQYALSFQIVRGNDSVNLYSRNLKNAHFIMTIPQELLENFRLSIQNLNFASISQALKKIYNYINELSNMPILGVQINSLNLILICIQQLNEMDTPGELIKFEDMHCFNEIASLGSLEAIEKYVENIIYNLINTVNQTSVKKTASIIPQIENYLHEHIYEDISLVSIARIFYISPIYLSQLFKKETGYLYIDYLTDLKMNAAKRLLLTTNMMIYEISSKLGYKDSKYFSHLFEKKLGCKPSAYRKQNV